MQTEYAFEETGGRSEQSATTEFRDGEVLAPVLDESMIETQRREKFDRQIDYLTSNIDPSAEMGPD